MRRHTFLMLLSIGIGGWAFLFLVLHAIGTSSMDVPRWVLLGQVIVTAWFASKPAKPARPGAAASEAGTSRAPPGPK